MECDWEEYECTVCACGEHYDATNSEDVEDHKECQNVDL